jgi:hypothetical protein
VITLPLTKEQALAVIDACAFYDLERSEYLRDYPGEYTDEERDDTKDRINVLRGIEKRLTAALEFMFGGEA